jgi:hypothetical protein
MPAAVTADVEPASLTDLQWLSSGDLADFRWMTFWPPGQALAVRIAHRAHMQDGGPSRLRM